MICSLNEIDAALRRAARGSGLVWGLAEEAGRAARWLAARRLDALPLFAALFERNDGRCMAEIGVERADGVWRAAGGLLCPISAGAALADRAEAVSAGQPIETGPVACPLLLAPFAALAAAATGVALDLDWPGARLRLDREGACVDGPERHLLAHEAERSACRPAEGGFAGRPLAASAGGVEIDPDVWGSLDRFVQRTYVPASELSRLKGAGAGLLDND